MDSLKEWLTSLGGFGSQKMEEIGFLPFLALMCISLLCSLLISFLYSRFYQNRASGSQVHKSFPLLGTSITAIFICIQFSLPLSLGLLGALSIVRFRTPIKEPEEIGFIMLVIATSICCATFNLLFLIVILVVALIALLTVRFTRVWLSVGVNDGMLIISMPSSEYSAKNKDLFGFLTQSVPKGRVESITEGDEESVLSYSFSRMDDDVLQNLPEEMKKITQQAKTNVFFNRAGDV